MSLLEREKEILKLFLAAASQLNILWVSLSLSLSLSVSISVNKKLNVLIWFSIYLTFHMFPYKDPLCSHINETNNNISLQSTGLPNFYQNNYIILWIIFTLYVFKSRSYWPFDGLIFFIYIFTDKSAPCHIVVFVWMKCLMND